MKPLFLTFFLLVCLGGCSPHSLLSSSVATLDPISQERGLGGYVSDSEIQTRLNVVLFEHDHIMHHCININVYEGRVLLTGSLPTKELQEEAVRLSWQVPGVKVVIDETTVGDSRTLTQYALDRWIATKLNTLLFIEHEVGSRNYEIIVVNGVVYLVGLSKDEKELNKVIEICRTTKNVSKVVSYVRLMDQFERRRRKVFNKRKHPSPMVTSQKERSEKITSKELRTSGYKNLSQADSEDPMRRDK